MKTGTGVYRFKIKPSSLGSPCERKVYYASSGIEPDFPFTIDGKKRMLVGDAIHGTIHDIFQKSVNLIKYYNPDGSIPVDWKNPKKEDREFPLRCDELYIKQGKIDGVFVLDDQLWLAEYKSISDKQFATLKEPKPEHIIQAVVYWYVFNKMLSEGKFSHIKELNGFSRAEGMRWLYFNKDTQEFREFTMTQGDEIFSRIVNRIINLKHHFDNKTLPPKTPDFCSNCQWRDKCKKNFNIE